MSLRGKNNSNHSNSNQQNYAPNWTQSSQRTNQKPAVKSSNWRYLKYFIFFVCGVLIFYSVVPWQAAGKAIGGAIVTIPLVKQLQSVPLLGLAVSLMIWILPNLMAVLLWALTQLVEITPVLLHDKEIYSAVVKELKTTDVSPTSGDDRVAKFEKKASQYLLDVFRNIGLYAALAYVTELTVNLWFYLPYGNGWSDFVRDFGVWGADLIKWGAFFLMIGSIAVVEILVLFMLNVHRLFKAISPQTQRRI